MINLLKPFFRSKVKVILLLIVFTIIFISFTFLLYYKERVNVEIEIIENKVNNCEMTFMLNNDLLLGEIRKNENIENIDVYTMGETLIVTIIVDEINNINRVIDKLDSLGIEVSLSDTGVQDELNNYKSIKLMFNIFIIVVVIFLIIIIYVEIKLLIVWDIKDISLLKILGYSNLYICELVIYKLYILLGFSFIISMSFFIVSSSFYNLDIEVKNLIMPLVYSIAIVIFQVPMLYFKVKNVTTGNAL